MKKIKWSLFLFTFFMAISFSTNVLAGPGGFIVKSVSKSIWLKILLIVLTIIFLPVILYITFKEKIKVNRTLKELKTMAIKEKSFNWLFLKGRIKDCYLRIHSSWSDENLKESSQWMTNWYWQNQQLVYIEKWKKDNLINVCEVKNVSSILPIYFEVSSEEEYENSRVVVLISSVMKDYLKNKTTEKIVEGDKKFKEVETIWTLVLQNSKWVVENIEDSNISLSYVGMENVLPVNTLVKQV